MMCSLRMVDRMEHRAEEEALAVHSGEIGAMLLKLHQEKAAHAHHEVHQLAMRLELTDVLVGGRILLDSPGFGLRLRFRLRLRVKAQAQDHGKDKE